MHNYEKEVIISGEGWQPLGMITWDQELVFLAPLPGSGCLYWAPAHSFLAFPLSPAGWRGHCFSGLTSRMPWRGFSTEAPGPTGTVPGGSLLEMHIPSPT